MLTIAVAVAERTCGELLELHHILSEGPCFVREHILHLAQLLIQITGLDVCRHVLFRVVNEGVPLDKKGLHKLDHFESHHEGNGDQVATLLSIIKRVSI